MSTQTIATPTSLEAYLRAPQPDEIDLVDATKAILARHGLDVDAFLASHDVQEAVGRNESVQRYWLNRYWNVQLMSVPANSIEERFCLIPNGSAQTWLDLFEKKIVAFCKKHGLPKVLS